MIANKTRMTKLTAFFLAWSCSFCCAVQVFAKDAQGKVTWKDSPVWRDRSVVPTPQLNDVVAYKKRGQKKDSNRKKNLIQRIFFSMPVGAQLPLYYTNQQVPDNESSRYFSEKPNSAFRSDTWGLQQSFGNGKVSPEIEARTIAGENLLPAEREMKYHGIGGEYLRPRTINRYRIIKNKEQFFKRPSRTQGLLNVFRRSNTEEQNKKRNWGHPERQNATQSEKNAKKSGLPKGNKRSTSRGSRDRITSEIEDLLTKFLIVL
ncbi:uncharacterized protein LOC141897902 isoform X5 [Acropora palmata]|uniref:uncharacterized protein LOC141897902 isoform X5 n=1 Tax=Acropora palmata TaxID=6131 RepID=UPI003D9FFCF1